MYTQIGAKVLTKQVAAAVVIPDYGGLIQLALFVIVIVIGLATAEKIEAAPKTATPK